LDSAARSAALLRRPGGGVSREGLRVNNETAAGADLTGEAVVPCGKRDPVPATRVKMFLLFVIVNSSVCVQRRAE
jgi:hypothetical protein